MYFFFILPFPVSPSHHSKGGDEKKKPCRKKNTNKAKQYVVVEDAPLHLPVPSTLPTSFLLRKNIYVEGHFCPLVCFLLSPPKAQSELQSNAVVH